MPVHIGSSSVGESLGPANTAGGDLIAPAGAETSVQFAYGTDIVRLDNDNQEDLIWIDPYSGYSDFAAYVVAGNEIDNMLLIYGFEPGRDRLYKGPSGETNGDSVAATNVDHDGDGVLDTVVGGITSGWVGDEYVYTIGEIEQVYYGITADQLGYNFNKAKWNNSNMYTFTGKDPYHVVDWYHDDIHWNSTLYTIGMYDKYNATDGSYLNTTTTTPTTTIPTTSTAPESDTSTINTSSATNSNNTLTGTDSNDSLTGTDSGEIIIGLYGDDYINASAGDDSLIGGSGKDTIYGGSGNDEITGGTGIDNLYGESGHDRFFISTGDGYDIIEDFIPGEDNIYSYSTIELRTRIYKNEHLLIYSGKDLMAGIRGGADFNLAWDANILS